MIDLVYILKEGASNWQDNEIRYSLRSAEKNLKFNNVVIVGYKPEFLKNVIHIPAADDLPEKHNNAVKKVLIACNDERVGEKFAFMNDDFFITKKINEIPYLHMGMIQDYLDSHRKHEGGIYYQAMKRTAEVLGKDALNYELHFPMVFEKSTIEELAKKFNLWRIVNFRSEPGYLIRSLYGNYFKVGGEQVKDNKFTGKAITAPIENDLFFSTNNSETRNEVTRFFIKQLFPNKSKHEH
jgi:hypothetical protein